MSEDKPEGHEESRRSRSRLDALLPDMVRKAIVQGSEAIADEKLRESIVRETVRKALLKGGEVMDFTEEGLRRVVGDLPKEVVDRLASRVEEHKDDLIRIVKDEVHELLSRFDLGAELQKLLTSHALEISMRVRFVANPREEGRSTKLKVSTQTRILKNRKKRRAAPRQWRPGRWERITTAPFGRSPKEAPAQEPQDDDA